MKKIISENIARIKKRARSGSHYQTFIYFIAISYIITVSAFMIWHRAWLSPDQFFALAILSAILIGRTKQFLLDWVPLLILFFGYEYLRGLIPELSRHAHILPMIVADHFLFGFIPTVKLQSMLFNSKMLHWYDYASVTLYISHFVIPMVVAFLFWLHDRKNFREFLSAFLVLSYLAFLTYIIFPAMPPWMASEQGFLPPLQKIMDQVLASFANPISVPSIYQYFGANLVAAVPSLHAAYPLLIFLFVVRRLKYIGLLTLPYVLGVWFSVIYLGEHYFFDVIIGILYALCAFLMVIKRKEILAIVGQVSHYLF